MTICERELINAVHQDQRAIVAKDVHLMAEAAIVTDRLVTSRMKDARKAFKGASNGVNELKQIVWVNPTWIMKRRLSGWTEWCKG